MSRTLAAVIGCVLLTSTPAFAQDDPSRMAGGRASPNPPPPPPPPPANPPPDEAQPPPGPPPANYVPFDISLVHPVNIFHFDRTIIVGLSLNIFHGMTAAVYGLEVGGFVNVESEDMGGIQVGGIYNKVMGDQYGLQVAFAGVSIVDKSCYGIQVAGFVQSCNEGGGGIEIAGLVGLANKAYSGLQIGGFAAGSTGKGADKPGYGIIAAGFVAIAGNGVYLQVALGNAKTGDGGGIQLSPFINNAEGDYNGLSISLVNFYGQSLPVTSGNTTSWTEYPDKEANGLYVSMFNKAQVAKAVDIGIINMARVMYGLQIGLVNFASELHGVQLGGFNVSSKNGLPFMVGFNAGF